MAQLVQACHNEKPESKYVLGVDKGKNTLHDICEAISKRLGIGKLREWSDEEAKENMLKYDGIAATLQLNLEFSTEEYTAANLTIEWIAENGIVEHIGIVSREFINAHKLFPVRAVLLGPPAAGKSYYAKLLSEKYYLPIATITKAIEYAKLDADLLEEMNSSLEEAKDKRYPVEVLSKIMKRYLQSPEIRNKGYILDGYPRTFEEAQGLFNKTEDEEGGGDEEENDGQEPLSSEELPEVNMRLKPASVMYLNEEDKFLQKRVLAMPQEEVEGTHNNEAGFKRRIKKYRNDHNPKLDNTTFTYFEVTCKMEIMPIKVSIPVEEAMLHICTFIDEKGVPYNYHPTPEEIQQKKEQEQKEIDDKLQAEKEDQERKEEEERIEREKLENEHVLYYIIYYYYYFKIEKSIR